MSKKEIKTSKVSKEVEDRKNSSELLSDINSFIGDRDRTGRGNNGKKEDLIEMSEAEIEVQDMLYKDSIKIKPLPKGVIPMFNSIFLTARRNKIRTESGLYLSNALMGGGIEVDFSAKQTVLAHGPQVTQAKTGCEVVINFENFRKQEDSMVGRVNKVNKIIVPTIMVDDVEYIRISERDLDYISKDIKK